MRRRGLTCGTIDKRIGIVYRWIEFVGDPFGADWRDVDRFVDASNMRAATSRYAAVSHLHAFYLWAQRCELCDHDPTILVERPRIGTALPRPVHDTDLAFALTVATGTTRAALCLAAFCGLRCVELARLRWADVDALTIRVHGKNDRERVLPMPPAVVAALDGLERVGPHVLEGWQSGDRAPGRVASYRIRRFFQSIGSAATAHQLRHWCATRAYATSKDLGVVQDYLGHVSPATTRIYARLNVSQLEHVAANMAPPALASS